MGGLEPAQLGKQLRAHVERVGRPGSRERNAGGPDPQFTAQLVDHAECEARFGLIRAGPEHRGPDRGGREPPQ